MLTCKATFPPANYGNNYIVNWKKQLRTHFLLCGLQTKRVISKPMKLLKSTQCIRFIIILHQGFNIIYRKWRTKTLFVVDPGSIRWTTFINQMNNSIYRKLRKNSLLNIFFLQDGIETCHIISSRKKKIIASMIPLNFVNCIFIERISNFWYSFLTVIRNGNMLYLIQAPDN